MNRAEYLDCVARMTKVLEATRNRPIEYVFKDFVSEFPEGMPPFEEFADAYRKDIQPRELLRALYPRRQVIYPQLKRTLKAENLKQGIRHDPHEIRRPVRKFNDWKDKYDDPTIIFESKESMGDVALCYLMDEDARKQFEVNGNMLFVMEAFFRRVDMLVFGEMEDEQEIPIQAWMAKALADGFKQYHSRRFLHREKITLDAAFNIAGKKRQEEFDLFTIDNNKLLDKAREVQWYCNLKFAPALKFAWQILDLEHDARGDNVNYNFTHADLRTICTEEARGSYPSYAAWHEDKGYAYLAGKSLRESFLDLMEAISPDLKEAIKTAMKDTRKRLFR